MLMPGPGGPYQITFQPSPLRQMIEQVRPKNIQLPPIKKVTETLGALGTIARQFLIRSANPEKSRPETFAAEANVPLASNSNYNNYYDDLFPAATSNINSSSYSSSSSASSTQLLGAHPLAVNPETDEQLLSALYTLGRNVLGQVRN